jgi:hypothetical protein
MCQGLSQPTLIDGFTITNGWATGTSSDDYGGGIYCHNTAPTIRNNVIWNNSGYSRGGGIYVEDCSPQIIGNIIKENGSNNGGGISCYDDAGSLIRENYFNSNDAASGGAICSNNYNCNPTIQHNNVFNNIATHGGGVGCRNNSSPLIHYNNICGNNVSGVYNGYPHLTINAEYNWWGHSTGPDSLDIDGNVDYTPWLTEEIVFDIAVDSIVSPPDIVGPGITYTPKIIVRNNCNYNYPITFFTAKCVIDGYQDYVRIDREITQGSTLEVSFADWTVPPQHSTTYFMKITVFYAVDKDTTNNTITRSTPTPVIENDEIYFLPLSFSLSQNYPNPFNPQTTIRYALAEDCKVSLVVYNVLGQKIRELVDEFQTSGVHEAIWDGSGSCGESVSSGIYFYKLTAEKYDQHHSEIRKMLLLR